MTSRRTAKVASAILESVSSAILFELRDPRVKNVTVLAAEPSYDVRTAKIYVSVMGDAKTQALTLRGLNSARGFLQAKVAERLQTKNTPILTFVLDQAVKKSIATSVALRKIEAEHQAGGDPNANSDLDLDDDLQSDASDELSAIDNDDGLTSGSPADEMTTNPDPASRDAPTA